MVIDYLGTENISFEYFSIRYYGAAIWRRIVESIDGTKQFSDRKKGVKSLAEANLQRTRLLHQFCYGGKKIKLIKRNVLKKFLVN